MSSAVFAYQWMGHELGTATDVEINGAIGQTYTVTAQDEGKALKVRASFTDDAGNEESLTSKATGPVAAALPPLTVSYVRGTLTETGYDPTVTTDP